MKVSELARAAGVSPDTVRFYTRQGLLHPRRDSFNNYQHYSDADLQRLRFVRRARELGFGLPEITEILQRADAQQSPCPLVRELFEQKLAEVDRRVAELTQLRDRMRVALQQWQTLPDGVPDGASVCHLIESWDRPGADHHPEGSHHDCC